VLARDGGRYAVAVEDADTDPIIRALATPDGTCEGSSRGTGTTRSRWWSWWQSGPERRSPLNQRCGVTRRRNFRVIRS
jgi:hypothetical protein